LFKIGILVFVGCCVKTLEGLGLWGVKSTRGK